MMTYGDGVSNINLKRLLKHHKKSKNDTVTASVLSKIWGSKFKGNNVVYFKEKSKLDEGWINGVFL